MRPLQTSSIAFVVALAGALPLQLLTAQDRPAEGPPDVETVGLGERRVAPDRATVLIQIINRAASAGAAAIQNARDVEAVRDTLRRLGLTSAVTNASYNVGPDYERPTNRDTGPTRVGYAARSVLRVQLLQLSLVGPVIDAGFARGATGVDGVYFESSRAEAARREALADAAAAARADAEALAQAMGGSLGALISTSTAGGNDPRRMNVSMRLEGSPGFAGAATAVTPNEIVIRAGVVGRWRFVAAR